MVSDFLRLRSSASHTRATWSWLRAGLCLPPHLVADTTSEFKLLEQTAGCRSCLCLSHVEFPLKLFLQCHKTTGLVKCSDNNTRSSALYAILHSARCLLGSKLLTFTQPVITAFFTFPVSLPLVVRVSNCCVFI
jgi:hypothetical protein